MQTSQSLLFIIIISGECIGGGFVVAVDLTRVQLHHEQQQQLPIEYRAFDFFILIIIIIII